LIDSQKIEHQFFNYDLNYTSKNYNFDWFSKFWKS